MSEVISINRASSPSEYAKKYAALGWKLIPAWWVKEDGSCACGNAECRNIGKHPIGSLVPFGQNSASNDVRVLAKWFDRYPNANLAVWLAASGLVAIDVDPRNGGIDTMDALQAKYGPLVSDVMQLTGGGGEHHVFLLPLALQLPGKLGPGVDVKANGYIMVEPSNHASGKRYDWEASSNPLEGARASPLPDWIRDLGSESVGAPVGGGERLGVPLPQDIEELRSALETIDADEREVWLRVGMALHADVGGQAGFDLWDKWSEKSTKYDARAQMKAWRSFKIRPDGVGKASIFDMAYQAGWVAPSSGVAQGFEGAPVVEQVRQEAGPMIVVDTVPGELLRMPGVLQALVDHINASAHKIQPVFAVMAALSFGATVMGRKYATSPGGNRTNLYLIGIGPTGCGKDHARQVIKEALILSGLETLIAGEDVRSDAALLSRVANSPSCLFQFDEFGKMLQAIGHAKAANHERGIVTVLMKMYSSANSKYFGPEYADQRARPRQDIEAPCINLHSTTTAETLFDALTSANVSDGSLNRFLFCFSDAPGARRVRPAREASDIPTSVTDWARTIANPSAASYFGPMNPVRVPILTDAAALLWAFSEECDGVVSVDHHGLGAMWARGPEYAYRVALVVAGSVNGETPAITIEVARWAIDFVRYWLGRTCQAIDGHVANSEFQAVGQRVVEQLKRRGPMKGGELGNYCPAWKALTTKDRAAVMQMLVDDGAVDCVRINIGTRGGRPGWLWSLVTDDE